MNAVKSYLRLASAYCDYLGGLRWSSQEDALEYPDGSTFAFNEETALFLEGFASSGRLIPFAHVLHLLDLLRSMYKGSAPGSQPLSRAFADAGRPLRNAGAFCAVLCHDLPEAAGPVPAAEVLARLRNHAMPIRWYIVSFHDTFFPAEVPPLGPAAFEQHILRQLAGYSPDDLAQWLRHGRGPVRGAAEALARALPPPRTLLGALATLLERPRLAGARPFVAQLVSALTLPLRRLAPPELPVGGYTDVTTHGQPDQILPGQLALDEWDFLRRYADRELLYFRREEPHARTEHELVVLLDQGVRTWGDVRLVLGAAVLALGRQAARQRLPFYVATTSGGGEIVDPLQADDQMLGSLLEASDLTAHPGLALERVLQAPARAGRDVVLLTHPRSLHEEDVCAAARRVAAGTRLFALALDGHGQAELSELKHGAPVPVRQFRVDLSAAAPSTEPAPAAPATRRGAAGPWRGDVEPIGFPFQIGVGGPIGPGLFDFDHAGDWLLTASQGGMLHAWKVDGSGLEVLPRGMLAGQLLTRPQAVVGVAGGFVVGGPIGGRLVAFHYDFARRTCKGRVLYGRPPEGGWQWHYSPAHHALLVHQGSVGWALDLATGGLYASWHGVPLSRARQAWLALKEGQVPAPWLHVLGSPAVEKRLTAGPCCYLDPDLGELHVYRLKPPWKPFTPRADGRPVLQRSIALEAQCRGTTLAVKMVALGASGATILRLFRGPEGTPLGEYLLPHRERAFALSADGNHLALLRGDYRVEIRSVAGGSPVIGTRAGGFSPHLELRLGSQALILRATRSHLHALRWDRGPLEIEHVHDGRPTGLSLEARRSERRPWPELVLAHSRPGRPEEVPAGLRYDPHRFLVGTEAGLIAVADRFGQVVVLDRGLEIVAMFFAFRNRLAGWLPDGTCFGPSTITGRPETPGALEKFGQALRRAEQAERSPT
jgi:hypothetical protein